MITTSFHVQLTSILISNQITRAISLDVDYLNTHGDCLLSHSTLDKSSFADIYQKVTKDNSILQTSHRIQNANNPNNPYTQQHTSLTQMSQDDISAVSLTQNLPLSLGDMTNFYANLRDTLEVVLCTSLNRYKRQETANAVSSQLQAYNTEVLTETDTAETVEMLDTEQNVTAETLQQLVDKSTKSAFEK